MRPGASPAQGQELARIGVDSNDKTVARPIAVKWGHSPFFNNPDNGNVECCLYYLNNCLAPAVTMY
jgi:hypothetical protein